MVSEGDARRQGDGSACTVAGKGAALRRDIDLFGATGIGIGAIIGSGIFIVVGIVAGVAGPALILSILIAGAISVFSAVSIAELSCYMPVEGGTYVYAQRLISPLVGFIGGWIWIFSNIFVGAAVSTGFALYFTAFAPAIPVRVIAVAVCCVFIAINYAGIDPLTTLNEIFVVLKILILAFFIIVGVWFIDGGNYVPVAPSGAGGILGGAALMFFAFTGFARISIVAEEVRDPVQTIPRSIFLALGISTVIYLGVGFVAVGLSGSSALAASGAPLATAMAYTGIPWASPVVTLGALIATASVLLTTILGISRIAYAMAREGDLPSLFSSLHPRFCTPGKAILISGAGIILAILFADLVLMVAVSTFAMLLYYLIANLAAVRVPPDQRKFPAAIPRLGALTCVGLAAFLSPQSWFVGIVGTCAGLLVYQLSRGRHRRHGPKPS